MILTPRPTVNVGLMDRDLSALVERLDVYGSRQRKHAVSSGVYVKALLRDGASLNAVYQNARAAARRAQTAMDLDDAVSALRECAMSALND